MSAVSVSTVYVPLLISAATLIFTVISFFYLKSYLKRRTEIMFIQDRILSEIREEVDGILSAIDETADRDISLIDEREKSAKALLEEIDKRLGVYVRELEKRRAADDAYAAISSLSLQKKAMLQRNGAAVKPDDEAKPGLSSASSPPAFPLPAFRVKEQDYQEPPAPEERNAPTERTPAEQAPVKQDPAERFAPAERAPSQEEQIRELVRAGYPPPLIASRLGISIAQVEFAAALQERRVITGT